ncbi:glycosyltransferase family 39 protein [Sphingomonas sp.]|uniref:glycosyltransferase family 39 protein n=1 Tax=Sphingomonas sp. TaxID=28214 RepID=UPI003CC6A3C9
MTIKIATVLHRVSGARALPLGVAALALLLFLAKPIVFVGGGSDDMRYLAAARAWWAHGPVVGTLHWELRHPLVLPVALATGLFGEGRMALLLVPVGYALGLLMLGTAVLRARFGVRAAALWGVLAAASPLVHELATRLYPDLAEAMFVCVSLACCEAAARRTRRAIPLLAAGVSASLALLTRETSFFLPLLYAACFVAGQPLRRRDWLLVAAGAAPLLLLENGWLWAATGDPFYRLHVALHHVAVPSDHMAGGTFSGPVLMNPALAERWVPAGPVDVHWTVNPILYLVLDPFYGGEFLLGGALWWTARGRVALEPAERRWLARAGGVAALAFVFVTYVLMVSQRPRYYVLALLAVLAWDAVLAARLWPVRPRLTAALVGLALVASVVIVAVRHAAGQGQPAAAAHR